MATQRGLGKGIGALIPNVTEEKSVQNTPNTNIIDTVDSSVAVYSEIRVDHIIPNPNQPRRVSTKMPWPSWCTR